MKFKDSMALNGELSIWKVTEAKGAQLLYKEDNLITKAAKLLILAGIYGTSTTDAVINLKVGSGGTIDPEGLYPLAEDPLQTDLHTPEATIPVTYTVDTDQIAVTFVADVDQSTLNGTLINEAGLFKTSSTIFNVKNHPGIAKTADFALHYEWRIKVS